jgi:two-component system chemotaxis sensor kinase CheA
MVRTVLIVEDEWAIADWLSDLLQEQNYRVLVASNGRRALEILKDTRPDIVLTDFMMPVMDGAGLLKAMRSDGLHEIPAIVMSSLPAATIAERAQGYQAFLRKPFSEDELRAVLDRLLPAGD